MNELQSAGDVETKRLEVKLEGDKGEVRAVIATLNVVDKDGDFTERNAFGRQMVEISSYGHGSWKGKVPLGGGVIYEVGDEAIFEGRFNLKSQAAAEHYSHLMFMKENFPDKQTEWSYGFDKIEWAYKDEGDRRLRVLKKVKAYEVSPVLLGAGVNTRTLDVKEAGTKFVEQVEAALAANSAMIERAKSLADLRVMEGRSLSTANRERLTKLLEGIKAGAVDLGALLQGTEAKAPEDDTSEKARQLYLRFLQAQTKLRSMEVRL